MMDITKELSKYIKDKGITITAIAKATGISYDILAVSLSLTKKRKLRADEYLSICCFLEIEPMKFYKDNKNVFRQAI